MKGYSTKDKKKYCIFNRVLNFVFAGIILCFILFVLLSVARIYIFDWYSVPSGSMSPTLNIGDKIIVDKRIAGARIYKSFDFSQGAPLLSYRTKGKRKIAVNDIVVFNFPLDSTKQKINFKINYVYVKRCVALPGDTVSINNGFIKNNNYTAKIGLVIEQRKLSFMDSLYLARNNAFPKLFDKTQITNWTIKDFGPLWIPLTGSSIELTPQNLELYKLYIEYETGNKITTNANGSIVLGGSVITNYVFTKNYYFVCGDNSISSYDSRNWGLVPEEFIVGVVGHIIHK